MVQWNKGTLGYYAYTKIGLVRIVCVCSGKRWQWETANAIRGHAFNSPEKAMKDAEEKLWL